MSPISIEQSPNDKREYRLITLPNSLEAMLISDPQTDRAGCCLSLNVGHLSDPDDLPGLAHFNEHMLFLGTKQFPDEAEYKRYLSAHAGSSNASTSMDETKYHFVSSNEGLEGALLRHSAFFKSPLFDPSCVTRELNAVDSEFRRNLQLDTRRLFQLTKATSSRSNGAVYWKFGTGSRDTLDVPDLRERLISWYRENYSSNLMKLAVLSSHSLDELENMIREQYSEIPNLNLEVPSFVQPLGPEELNQEITFRTIKNVPSLRIDFPLPELKDYWKEKPSSFIGHNIGHEGVGSITSFLKQIGLATSLSAGGGSGANGFSFFRVDVGLTAEGLKSNREVVQIVFAYLELLKSTPVRRSTFDEIQALGKIAWTNKEQSSSAAATVNYTASLLQESQAPRDQLFISPYFATEFNPQLIQETLSHLRRDNCRIFIGSQEPLEGRVWTETEQYYSTEYETRKLDLKASSVVYPALHLPKDNPFIPTNLTLIPKAPASSADQAARPVLIKSSARSRLFYKRDSTWLVPKSSATFLFKTPITDRSALDAVKTQLYAQLVEESLAEITYDCSVAGLGYSLGTDVRGLELYVSGYSSDKFVVMLEMVLKSMKSFKVDEQRFAIILDRLQRAYRNAELSNPSSTAELHMRHMLRETHYTYEERLKALMDLKPIDIQDHSAILLSELSIDALIAGNVTKEDALSMSKSVDSIMLCAATNIAPEHVHRALVPSRGVNLVYRPLVPSAENVNSAIVAFYYIEPVSDHTAYTQLQLFSQLLSQPIFSELRTKQQLGYIVSSGALSFNHTHSGFRVVVQSERTGEYLEDRVEELWRTTAQEYLENLTEEDFAKQRSSLIEKKLEKAKNSTQETNRYWAEISSGEFDFFHREREAALIALITKQDILNFYSKYIHPDSIHRSKLSILMRSERLQPDLIEGLARALEVGKYPIAAAGMIEFAKTKPTIPLLRAFFTSEVIEIDEKMRNELNSLIEEMERPVLLQEGQEEILDLEIARARMTRGDVLLPMADFNTDLVSHL